MSRFTRIVPGAFLGLLLAFGAIAASSAPQEQPNRMPFLTLAGADSKIDEPACFRITTASEFQTMYLRHLGEDPEKFDQFYSPHGVPLIDFDRCMVLAVFRGRTSNMAGVYVHSAAEEGDRFIVRLEDRTFQTAGPAPDGGRRPVTPYGIFVLPRSDKDLVVEQDVRRLKAAPREWREKVRFDAVAGEPR